MDPSNALLTWPCFSLGKTTEELRQTLVYTTLELEQIKLMAEYEVRKRDEELIHLEDVLTKTLKERDEALEKCHHLLLLQQHKQEQEHITLPLSGSSSIEDNTEESIMSPSMNQASQVEILLLEKPLPEKGNLLQAVLKAGPLLQTLLLAGPMPQWHHPPPPLDTSEIPPVTVSPRQQFHGPIVNNSCGSSKKKRAFSNSEKRLLH